MRSTPLETRGPRRLRLPGKRARLLLGGLGAAALALAATVMPGTASAATTICNSQTGNNGGMYYQMWTNGQGSACITLNSSNSYSTSWSGVGDFVDGVGWNPGSNQTVSFSGSLNANGGTTLVSLYGWSTNPLVEYYVEEDYVGSPNTAGQYMGQMTSDGGTYSIYEHQQVNQPSIVGTATFEQYLAIRTSPTSSGTITTQNFFNAWSSHGMNLGTMNYQILATEAWGGGSGNSSVTIGTSTPPSSAPPSTTPPSTKPPTSSPPSTPPGGPGTCKATYSVVSSWTGGFQATVTVANSGSSTINSWTVPLTLASGQTITQLWNGTNSGTSGAITVKNAAYNGTLAPGASTTFGFTANGNGATAPSSISCTSP
ncbi:MAG TPA: glycoside hydrolase family 11 protein [Actinocrinis sp.]|uniref:glycoside hydrolase family 11 protein n=1 Tax=Actinocrinis sp. TaxID=1920516 RepID=UPI002DDD34F2|nr:glycoside hydrolase family 11 protein [Actinocrinis sp.]HEV2342686.1 glycoside hydrolase family 11 protein [Actinocrinis sp.]